MKTLALFAALVALPARAGDTIYKWVDKDGEEHFTNDPGSIPPGQPTTTTQGAELGVLTFSKPETPTEPAKGREPPKVRPAPMREEPKADDRKAEEQRWRQRFQQAQARVAQFEALVAQDQKNYDQLKDVTASETTTNLPDGRMVTNADLPSEGAKAQLEQDQRSLKEAKEALQDLDRAASREAVPREWRR